MPYLLIAKYVAIVVMAAGLCFTIWKWGGAHERTACAQAQTEAIAQINEANKAQVDMLKAENKRISGLYSAGQKERAKAEVLSDGVIQEVGGASVPLCPPGEAALILFGDQ